MSIGPYPRLAAHLKRHARKLRNIACGFGRHRDADDIIQILYVRWWRRMRREPGWAPPEDCSALFVCVKRVVLDQVNKDKRSLSDEREPDRVPAPSALTDDKLHAFERLQWILTRLPLPLAEVLTTSLSAGRRKNAELARELGITVSAYTSRLFRARRAAEQLATYYDLLSPQQATLMAELNYSGKSHVQIAHDLCLLLDELIAQ